MTPKEYAHPEEGLKEPMEAAAGQVSPKLDEIKVPDEFRALLQTQLHFLGVTLEVKGGELIMHQHNYILSKLHRRNLLKGKQGQPYPPALKV